MLCAHLFFNSIFLKIVKCLVSLSCQFPTDFYQTLKLLEIIFFLKSLIFTREKNPLVFCLFCVRKECSEKLRNNSTCDSGVSTLLASRGTEPLKMERHLLPKQRIICSFRKYSISTQSEERRHAYCPI